MYGYFIGFVAILAVILLVPIFIKSGARPKGRIGQPVSVEEPAADELSPSDSVTATPAQKIEADKHTPPA